MTDDTFPPDEHLEDEILVAFIDGECSEPEHATVAAHLATCANCAARHDALARTTAIAATPVVPLALEVRGSQLARALAALDEAPPTGEADGAAVVALGRRSRRSPRFATPGWAAAAVLIVAAVAGGLFLAKHVVAFNGGTSAGPSAAGDAGTNPDGRLSPSLDIQLRPLLPTTPSSCAAANPVPAQYVAVPDAVSDAPRPTRCLLLGPALVVIDQPETSVVTGPAGVVGPDQLTVHLPVAVASGLLAPAVPSQHLVVLADAAAVGDVVSISPVRAGYVTVVIGDMAPAVADYLDSELGNR